MRGRGGVEVVAQTRQRSAGRGFFFKKNFWQSPRLTVRRIVLFALNQGFDRYSDLCQKLITDNMLDIFLESNYHHELYGIIAGHFSKFSKETQDVVIKVLDDLQRRHVRAPLVFFCFLLSPNTFAAFLITFYCFFLCTLDHYNKT